MWLLSDSILQDSVYQSICRCFRLDAGLDREVAPLDDGICRFSGDKLSGAGFRCTR